MVSHHPVHIWLQPFSAEVRCVSNFLPPDAFVGIILITNCLSTLIIRIVNLGHKTGIEPTFFHYTLVLTPVHDPMCKGYLQHNYVTTAGTACQQLIPRQLALDQGIEPCTRSFGDSRSTNELDQHIWGAWQDSNLHVFQLPFTRLGGGGDTRTEIGPPGWTRTSIPRLRKPRLFQRAGGW